VSIRRTLLVVAAGLYLLGLGTLAGVVIDRMQFDRQRSEVLARYEGALRQWQVFRMELERQERSH
jgi:hypothetical protein